MKVININSAIINNTHIAIPKDVESQPCHAKLSSKSRANRINIYIKQSPNNNNIIAASIVVFFVVDTQNSSRHSNI